ncbi:Uncharacterised protein [Sphingobacterium daejeonense]|nr:Uncharacterised protein [Sphingobacterium daejeonense]
MGNIFIPKTSAKPNFYTLLIFSYKIFKILIYSVLKYSEILISLM